MYGRSDYCVVLDCCKDIDKANDGKGATMANIETRFASITGTRVNADHVKKLVAKAILSGDIYECGPDRHKVLL